MTLVRFALRNVLRHRRRSLLTLAIVAAGLFVLVFLRALQDGYIARQFDAALGAGVGHVSLLPADEDAGIADGDGLARRLCEDPAIVAAAPRIRCEGFAKTADASAGVLVVGVDPEAETRVSGFDRELVEGAWLVPAAEGDTPQMVAGEQLAQRLAASAGDRVAVLVQGRDGALVAENFTLTGIVRTGGAAFDQAAVCVPRDVAKRLLLLDGDATEVVAKLRRPLDAPEVAARLDLPGARVVTWRDTAPWLVQAVEVFAVMERIRSAILLLLVGLAIFNTVTMSVAERRREFGVLMAVGMRPAAIFRCLVLEVGIVSFHGLVLGLAAALVVCGPWLGTHGLDVRDFGARLADSAAGATIIHPLVTPDNVVLATLWVAVLSIAVLVLPAWRILRLDPAEALRERA